jgi:UDP-N-acetylglucosamine transferase subunit ALG13
MDPDAFREKFRAARIVVAHAGMGTIIKARESGKPIIVMPRRADVGEHRNDHQLATARQLRELGAVSVAFDEQELIGQLENLDRIKASAAIDAHASNRLIHTLSNFIQTGSMAA